MVFNNLLACEIDYREHFRIKLDCENPKSIYTQTNIIR